MRTARHPRYQRWRRISEDDLEADKGDKTNVTESRRPNRPHDRQRASADGYTLIAGTLTTHVLIGALYTLPYDLLADFKPIALLSIMLAASIFFDFSIKSLRTSSMSASLYW
jgi:hypothetical protein